MKRIRIKFDDRGTLWRRFDVPYFLQCFPYLAAHYEFVETDDPDFVFYGPYNYHTKYNERAIRIVCAGEPGRHFRQAKTRPGDPGHFEDGWFHYGLTEDALETSPNHRYFPLPCLHLHLYNEGLESLVRSGGEKEKRGKGETPKAFGAAPSLLCPSAKSFFCDFIYSNARSPDRLEFCQQLSQYKRVECPGMALRNRFPLGPGYRDKQAFQAQCKFSIAFENTYFPGYVTEKLSDPLVAGSVPIYLGDPLGVPFLNPASFIDVRGLMFKVQGSAVLDFSRVIEHIIEVDNNPELYAAYAGAPPFVNNEIPAAIADETYLEFWRQIFSNEN